MDAKIIRLDSGEFTIGITGGDLTLEDSFETAIFISLFTDAEAPEGTVPTPESSRGWMGDLVSTVDGRKIGSLLWLLDQSRLIPDTLNKSINYAQLALKWFVEDGIARSVTVTGTLEPRLGVRLKITIVAISGVTTNYYVNLWETTANAT